MTLSYGVQRYSHRFFEETNYRPQRGLRLRLSPALSYASLNLCIGFLRVWLYFGWGWMHASKKPTVMAKLLE